MGGKEKVLTSEAKIETLSSQFVLDARCLNVGWPTGRPTADRLAQLVEHRTTVREVAGSNPGRTNTQGL